MPTDDGEATYARTSPVPQTETITARIANAGCTGTTSNTVTHEWWRGEIDIEQVDVRTVVGQSFVLEATLTHKGSVIPDAALELSAIDRFTAEPFEPITSITDQSGRATFTWSSSRVATELITVRELGPDSGVSAKTSHNWVAAITGDVLSLAVDPFRARVGETVVATATLSRSGVPVLGATVKFFTVNPDNWENPVDTDEDGVATFVGFAGPRGYVHAQTPSTGVVTTSIDVWTPEITFVSPSSSSAIGQDYPATVRVTDNGSAMSGVQLAFSAGVGSPAYATVRTDDNGFASAPLSTDGPGRSLDLVVTEIPSGGGTPVAATAQTTHRWLAPPSGVDLSVNLTQSGDNSRVGTEVDLTAEVSVGDGSLEGWDVAFAMDNDPLGVRTTDEDGVATIPATSDVESYAELTATVAIAGCSSVSDNDEIFHDWWVPDLDLTPKNATAPARRSVTFKAELTRPAPDESATPSPVPSQLIRFTQTSQSCSLPVEIDEDTTDEQGNASVSLTRDGPSIDGVTAEEVGVVGPASDATTHTWGTPEPPPLSITPSQSAASSRAGTSVTFTATVRDSDRPSGRAGAGIPVTFLGVSPARTVPTDGSGVARLTITGTGTSPTTVTATAPYGCGVVVARPITHTWFVPTLVLTPDNATTTVGDTASVTAQLFGNGHGVPDQRIELTIDSRTGGVATEVPTETTDEDGEAEFRWKRTSAGIDDLTAIELISVQPQQDTARHDWENGPTPPPDSPTPEEPDSPPPTTPTPEVSSPTPIEESGPPEETSSPSPTQTATTPPPPTTGPPSDLPATSTLVDGPEVGRPGADIEVSGTGCRAGQSLTVRLGETSLGRTRAAADGTFYLRGVVPDLPLGRYVIRSTCGTTIGDPNVDITAPQVNRARAAIAAVGVTTASTFVFFLLLAKGVISFLPRRPY
ncbi:MAG TPA: Ig-like domain-containing protein [Microlunatus sp.]